MHYNNSLYPFLDDIRICFHSSEGAEAINNWNINHTWMNIQTLKFLPPPASVNRQVAQERFLLSQLPRHQPRLDEQIELGGK